MTIYHSTWGTATVEKKNEPRGKYKTREKKRRIINNKRDNFS
jgi:hypothetical protein